MRGAYSTSFDSENDFVIDSHILAELRKQLRSKTGEKVPVSIVNGLLTSREKGEECLKASLEKGFY